MKNYNEMAADVFRRRDEYEAVCKKKRKMAVRAAVSISCLGLMIMLGIGVWQSGLIGETPSATTDEIQDINVTNSRADINPNTGKEQLLVINKLDAISSTRKMGIALFGDDFVCMSKQELKEYYGTEIFPAVPADLREWDSQNSYGYGIYKRNGGTGEVYWDQLILNYSNEDFTRAVNIEISKDGMPFSDYGKLPKNCDKSIINGTEVGIGQTDSGLYMVEFVHKSAGFRMVIEGLSEEELVSAVASLLQ